MKSPINKRCNDEIWQVFDTRGIGGIESQTLRLAKALSGMHIPNRIVFLGDRGVHPLEEMLGEHGLLWTKLKGGPVELATSLARARPRLVHTRGYKGGICGRVICRLLGIPVVSHFHAGEPGTGRLRMYNYLDSLTSPLAPAMAVSAPISDRIIANAKVINNMVDIPPSPARNCAENIAFVGRISHEKGPDYFISIAQALPKLTFSVFGDGPGEAQMRASAPPNVSFHGMVNSMNSYWKDIGLLCMPSRHEGLPNAALEAMANGVPVAAFGVGDLPRLLDGGAGWLVEPGNVEEMIAAILSWHQHADARQPRVGDVARAKVAREHGPEAVLPEVFQIYSEALKNRNCDDLQFEAAA